MQIGAYSVDTPIALAPMAGITDKPFRQLCRAFGAGWAVGEMLTSDPSLRHTRKTLRRSDFEGEEGVRVVQIAGSEPAQLAEAARYNVAQGAQVIDINMGCPAKKVCNVLAGWLTVKIMHGGQVLQHGCAAFGQAQLFGQLAVCGKIFHIAKQPRLPLRAAPDHHTVCAGLL